MTCCVAAAAAHDTVIVAASDSLASWGHTSLEGMLKMVRIQHPFWLAMLAGDDISIGVESVTRNAAATLAAYDSPPTVLQVRGALLGAWRDVQNEVGTALVLNAFRTDAVSFRKNGRKEFGDAKFIELAGELQRASRLGCSLLAYGFDEQKIPTLLVCEDDTGCRDFSRVGYIAIGSGGPTAIGMLAMQNYQTSCNLNTAIYQVCCAKFAAEKATDVGRKTLVVCLRRDGRTCFVSDKSLDPIRQLWEQHGRPRPVDADVLGTHIAPLVAASQWSTL